MPEPRKRAEGGRRALLAAVLVAVLCGSPAEPALAQSTWLDQPVQQWNRPGMALPLANQNDTEPALDPRCMATARPAESAFDDAIEAAGWSLFSPFQAGWGLAVIPALSGHDGMCRPFAYHAFVFVDGQFAGTLAPDASHSRSDGALSTIQTRIEGDGRISATFIRYAPDDPLCCPSRPLVAVSYRVERAPQGPVVLVDGRSELPRN